MRLSDLREQKPFYIVTTSPCPKNGSQCRAFVNFLCCIVGLLNSSYLADTWLQHDLRRWLSAPDPWTNHNVAYKTRHNGTATWFTQSETFNEWKSTGSVLWIYGIRVYQTFLTLFVADRFNILAGSGKTVFWYG